MFYQTLTACKPLKGPKNAVFCPWWPWHLTLTFKVVRARDQTRLPCEFCANPSSGSGDISHTNNKNHTDDTKNRTFHSSLHVVTTCLMALYPRQPELSSIRKKTFTYSLPTVHTCGHYAISLINFFQLLHFIASGLKDYFHNFSPGLLWCSLLHFIICIINIHFSPNHSSPFLKPIHTISTYLTAAL